MYLNKIIEVSGKIYEIKKNSIIVGDGMFLTNCAFSETELPKINKLQRGESIRIKGLFTGFNNLDVYLGNCIFVNYE